MVRAIAVTLILVIAASALTAGAAWRLKPGDAPTVATDHEPISLWKSVITPVIFFACLTVLAGGFVVREAAKSQQLHLEPGAAAYAVFLTALTGAAVIAGALSGLVLWPEIHGLGLLAIPFYALPAWVALTAAEGYVLHLATGISHGRAVILGVALNLILGTGAVIIAAFMVWGT
jgi:hypothetical protein